MIEQNINGYVDPEDANSPKHRWSKHQIVYNSINETGRDAPSWSVAVGTWDGDKCLAIRWNGDAETPLGSPKSHAYPTWFILPHQLASSILDEISDLAASEVISAIKYLKE
jgi:hypothetical protein